jgi:hypothetical protein
MTEARIELPPLPAPDFPDYEAYSDTTMREYARAAVLAERERLAAQLPSLDELAAEVEVLYRNVECDTLSMAQAGGSRRRALEAIDQLRTLLQVAIRKGD